MGQQLWNEIHRASESGFLSGAVGPYGFTRNFYWVGANAPISAKRVDTLQAAMDLVISEDVIMAAPQTHAEANLILPALDPTGAALKGVTLIGAGAQGDMWVNTGVAGDEGLRVLANYTTLINFGIGGGSSADYALNVRAVEGFRAFHCKFEGPDGTCVLLDGTATGQVSFARIYDCEFAFCGSALLGDNSAFGFPTQVEIKNCLFHNFTVVGVGDGPTGGGFADIWLTDNVFADDEAGAAPTQYINLARAGDSGIISGNRFSTPTHATGVLTIGAQMIWVANGTEAGWSTARPS